ncbi:MAG: ATP-binding cassette domain-containing protein [Desulfobacteraceae bacterium]|nr:ATP-binding cassette domain-containing protein [Desulfobacteraceae bacterium]
MEREAAADVVLAVRDLEKEFSSRKGPAIRALRGVSLQARRAQITGLVGADGAGKTTLIRTAAGLLVPTAGSVTVLGLDSVAQSIGIQSRVGYMPQKFGLYQDLTVVENMDLYADLQGVPRSERQARYRRLLDMTGLGPYTRRIAGALSGGMKQKLGLACCLIKSPAMLLLDEPTVGVDPVSRRELWTIVYELVEKNGIGVLLSTAYLDEAERCSHVVVLHEGEVLAEGTPGQFKTQVAGRVQLVTPPSGIKPRMIQTRLAGRAHIVDATIRSGRVRTVSDTAGSQAVAEALPEPWRGGIRETSPTFEDAFMALIPHPGVFETAADRPSSGATSPEAGKGGGEKTEPPVVKISDLRKFFGAFEAVKGLTFEVRHGEIFGLLGPNGAGKSTTFRMLCGLLKVSAGEISVAGHDLRRSRSRARSRLGYMAQQFSLYGQLSVQENLRFFGRAYGLDANRLRQRLEWAFAEFGLGKWRDHAAGSLPGGYKQRLAMAAALLHEPDILFLDEPTSGVDPFARREFWLRINHFAEQGVTVVVTTHFMEESEYCDRMLIMSQGKALAMGTPAEIRTMARSEENPEPTIEDAFITLAEGKRHGNGGAAK